MYPVDHECIPYKWVPLNNPNSKCLPCFLGINFPHFRQAFNSSSLRIVHRDSYLIDDDNFVYHMPWATQKILYSIQYCTIAYVYSAADQQSLSLTCWILTPAPVRTSFTSLGLSLRCKCTVSRVVFLWLSFPKLFCCSRVSRGIVRGSKNHSGKDCWCPE